MSAAAGQLRRLARARGIWGYPQPTAERSSPVMAKVPAIPARLRFAILKRDGYRCRTCGATPDHGVSLHVDHKRARALGGLNDPDNLWTLCAPCNLGKGVLLP